MAALKIAHLSDLHLGYSSQRHTDRKGINLREKDGYIAFRTVVQDVIANKVDVVVISGDVFHSPTPSIRTIVFVQNEIKRFAKAGIPVYILAGNHDTLDIAADIAASRVLHDPDRRIFSHIEPYVTHEILDGVHVHLVSHHMYSEQHKTMSEVKPVEGALNIFATHGSCIDPILQEKLHTEQSPREIVIPDFLLNDYAWDYTLLGHIHERGWVGSSDGESDTAGTKIFYNGSLVRRGFSDKECKLDRGWTLWTIAEDGSFTPEVHTVAQRPQVDFPLIDCASLSAKDISELVVSHLKESQVEGSNSFEEVTAPLLRQKLVNINAAKHGALDLQAINNASQHAFSWQMKMIAPAEVAAKAAETADVLDLGQFAEGADIVHVYDTWATTSEKLSQTDETIREKVMKQTRQFIEKGQELTLND